MMKKSNQQGSTIVTGIVIVMIIFIILGTALGIATSYQRRAIDEHARKQAYLNGISVVDTIAGQIANSTESSAYIPSGTTPVIITSIDLPENHGGELSAKIFYDNQDNNLLYIQVISKYANQTEKVQLTMQNYQNQWYKKNYSKIGDEFSHVNE